jgi:hypothetical protein
MNRGFQFVKLVIRVGIEEHTDSKFAGHKKTKLWLKKNKGANSYLRISI